MHRSPWTCASFTNNEGKSRRSECTHTSRIRTSWCWKAAAEGKRGSAPCSMPWSSSVRCNGDRHTSTTASHTWPTDKRTRVAQRIRTATALVSCDKKTWRPRDTQIGCCIHSNPFFRDNFELTHVTDYCYMNCAFHDDHNHYVNIQDIHAVFWNHVSVW